MDREALIKAAEKFLQDIIVNQDMTSEEKIIFIVALKATLDTYLEYLIQYLREG